jgi:hypothetical protein
MEGRHGPPGVNSRSLSAAHSAADLEVRKYIFVTFIHLLTFNLHTGSEIAFYLTLYGNYTKCLVHTLSSRNQWRALVIRHDRQCRPKQSGLNCLEDAIPILRLI